MTGHEDRASEGTDSGVLRTALEACGSGISVIPIPADGTRHPAIKWGPFQEKRADEAQLRSWFNGRDCGLAFVTGRVSGNLELFEFDDRDTYPKFLRAADEAGLGELVARIRAGYEEISHRNGIHWFYYCSEVSPNKKLASRPIPGTSDSKVLIETRGEGGYAIVAPSAGGVHPTGRAYQLVSGGASRIATITPQEREALWELARSFDEMVRKAASAGRNFERTGRPGDAFNGEAAWEEILEPAGWSFLYDSDGVQYWQRPGKPSPGVSATTNYAGSDLLYVFSTSTEFDAEQGYSKFGAYAILFHDGDFKEAARTLARQGYGDQGNHGDPVLADGFRATDGGNADRLVAFIGTTTKYCPDTGHWLTWGGKRWVADEDGEMMRRARATVGKMFSDAVAQFDSQKRDALLKHAKASEAKSRLDAMIAIAASDASIVVRRQELDANPMLLNCSNGTLNLATGNLQPYDPADLITHLSPVNYDREARSDLFYRFLTTVTNGDAPLQNFLQRIAGYSLTGDASEEVLVFLHGPSATGKSTFVEAIKAVLGDHAKTADFEAFVKKREAGIRNDLARLAGARVVVSNEVDEGKALAESVIKTVTGGDVISARFLHKEFFEYAPTFKLWLVANYAPAVNPSDEAMWRRILRVPFECVIPEEDRDPEVKRLLRKDPDTMSAVLAWAARGCREWLRDGLAIPECVRQASRAYRASMNPLKDYVEAMCVLHPAASVATSVLYQDYSHWCEAEHEVAVPRSKFLDYLRPFGVTDAKSNGGRVYKGIRALLSS